MGWRSGDEAPQQSARRSLKSPRRRRSDAILKRDIACEFRLRDYVIAIDIDIVETRFEVDTTADSFDLSSLRLSGAGSL